VEEKRLIIHVSLDMSRIRGPDAELVLPSIWGGAEGRAVVRLAAETPGTRIAGTTDRSSVVLRGIVRGRARISYELVKDWDGPLRESTRLRVHLEPAYFEVNTNNALVHPKLDQSASVDCRFDWKLPKDWSLATSFGAGTPRQRFRGPWDAVQNAVFAAGDFRLHPVKLARESQLIIAIRGRLSVSDDEMAKQIEKLVRMERTSWRDDKFPYYLVTVVPFDAGESGSGGGGFTNAFSLHLPVRNPLSPGVVSLIAHEAFHTWNPFRLGRMPSPAESIYWFTEGFTTYYQDLLLLRAELLSFGDYLETVNRFLRDYSLAADKNVSLKDLIERARVNQDKSRISYERGAAIALWLDWRVREDTKGRSSLDTLMFDLFRAARRRKNGFPELTPELVFEAASRHIRAEDLNQLRSYVESGSTVEAPAGIFKPCAIREVLDIPSFELGMNRADLLEKETVVGLKSGSNAQRAGLQEGDRVIGMSIYWNDSSKPVKLTIRRGLSTITAEYYPHGPSAGLAPSYVLDAVRYRAEPGSCHGLPAIRGTGAQP
jgi:predicted metalloprotease with PDZ domain